MVRLFVFLVTYGKRASALFFYADFWQDGLHQLLYGIHREEHSSAIRQLFKTILSIECCCEVINRVYYYRHSSDTFF